MKGFYTKEKDYFLRQTILFLFTILLCFYTFGQAMQDWLTWSLFLSTAIIMVTGMMKGLLAALGVCLVVLFVWGSLLIWSHFAAMPLRFSVEELIIWMTFFLGAAVTSGLPHRIMSTILAENDEMNSKFDELVSIDADTGFDNEKRFSFDLEEEFSRARRTGTPFSLLYVKILYFRQFVDLYGRKETEHLLQSLAELLRQKTRITDRKYRPHEDTFAILLANSTEENAQIVIAKIEKLLQHHTLRRKNKQITLTIAFGLASYREDMSDPLELIHDARKELEQYIQ